jgi:hypothetical protein
MILLTGMLKFFYHVLKQFLFVGAVCNRDLLARNSKTQNEVSYEVIG